SELLPFVRVPLPQEPDPALEWPDSGAAAYRFIIRDDTLSEIALKDAVVGTRYAVDWTALDRSHDYRYRVQSWIAGNWVDLTSYRALEPPAEPMPLRVTEPTPEPAPDVPEKLLFLFTVDTEIN